MEIRLSISLETSIGEKSSKPTLVPTLLSGRENSKKEKRELKLFEEFFEESHYLLGFGPLGEVAIDISPHDVDEATLEVVDAPLHILGEEVVGFPWQSELDLHLLNTVETGHRSHLLVEQPVLLACEPALHESVHLLILTPIHDRRIWVIVAANASSAGTTFTIFLLQPLYPSIVIRYLYIRVSLYDTLEERHMSEVRRNRNRTSNGQIQGKNLGTHEGMRTLHPNGHSSSNRCSSQNGDQRLNESRPRESRPDGLQEIRKTAYLLEKEVEASSKPLRVCRVCGLKAYTEDDLELFRQDKRAPYGHSTLCKKCHRERYRKGGIYGKQTLKRAKEYRRRNPDKIKKLNERLNPLGIRFKSKWIYLGYNPRKNICSECGKKYPEELKIQIQLHHDKYDPKNPLAHTRELCASCHTKLHRLGRGK